MLRCGHARLRHVGITGVEAFVRGLVRQTRVLRLVSVEHVGVVEDARAQAQHRDAGQRGGDRRGAGQARARQLQPRAHVRLAAAHPRKPRKHRQQHGPRDPVGLEREPRLQRRAEAADVRVRPVRAGAEHQQLVLDAQQRREGDQPIEHQRCQRAEVFLVHHRVHRQREQREQQVVGQLQSEQHLGVHADLEVSNNPARLGRLRRRCPARASRRPAPPPAPGTCRRRTPSPAPARRR